MEIQEKIKKLSEGGFLPSNFMQIIANRSAINRNTVSAYMNNRERVYISAEAKEKISHAAVQWIIEAHGIFSELLGDINKA